MDIFGKKAEKKIADLQSKIGELEKKGYYTPNTDNEYLKQQFALLKDMVTLIDFSEVSRERLVKMYETNAQVRGIVNLIANSVAELSDFMELLDKNDTEKPEHWAVGLLEKPNDRFNRRQFVKAWAINRLLTGDAFVYGKQGVGTKRGRFTELYVMNSQDIEIIQGGLVQPIKGYKHKNYPSLNSDLTPDNVMFSFEYNTDSKSFYGLSPLKSAAAYLEVLENALKRQNTALLNGGVANLVTPKPDAQGGVTHVQANEAEQEFNSKKNINKNKFIKIPLEVHAMGDKPTDLAILETSKDAVMALCFVYNIPIDIYLGQAKYENTKEAKKAVYEQAAIPLFNELIQDLTAFLKLNSEGLRLTLNTDKIEVLKNSATEQLGALEKMNASINEKREYMGYPQLSEGWANQPIIPMGVMLGYSEISDIDETSI